MHGAALIDGILAEALNVSHRHGDARVVSMDVQLSSSGHVSQDEVRSRLAALSRGTSAETAQVRITTTQRRFRCFSCGEVSSSSDPGPSTRCPTCDGVAVSIDEGLDCMLTAVEIVDRASGAD